MKINVTQEHIDRARKETPNRAQCFVCPVAQALTDLGFREVSVGKEDVGWVSIAGDSVSTWLPDVAVEWIFAFDAGLHVEPFSFEIEGTP